MTYNRTITKAAEIISVALVGAGIAADGWTMQIISAAPVAADADRYTVAVYQPRRRIPSTVWALTIDTAHDGWTIAARTMECTYNRDTTGAEYAPRHALASAMTGRIRITAPDAYAMHLAELGIAETTDTAETEQDAETAPAAEPETETTETTASPETETEQAAETETTETAHDAERDNRIADIIRDIRASRAPCRTKYRTTAKAIRDAMRAGVPTVALGYCELQCLFGCADPEAYTVGVYGWNFDVYRLGGLTICTGYRGMIGTDVDTTAAEKAAAALDRADLDKREHVLAEWIYTTLAALREGARV